VWKDIATVWASVKASGGAETFGDKGVTGSTTFLVRLRYRTGLTSQDRFIRNGMVLDVVSVLDPDGRRRELECVCVQHGNDEAAA
jgi:SPP1 family predicted phage head-tail adaptor